VRAAVQFKIKSRVDATHNFNYKYRQSPGARINNNDFARSSVGNSIGIWENVFLGRGTPMCANFETAAARALPHR